MRKLTILALVIVLAASFVPSALAQGKGKGKGNAAGRETFGLTFDLLNDVNGDGLPNWGDSLTFFVSTTEHWNQVNVTCSQNGLIVFGAVWPNTQVVTLSSGAWQSGAAECTAVVIAFNTNKPLASLSFTAGE